ncbi:MAG: hypothetical protein GEU26_14100 [Nitrososphaeraceae archaeon]|nr:hypothetical protein [Nitrososphaeraceae archaeon]
MAILRIYKQKSVDIDLSILVEAISESGLEESLQKFYDKPLEKETKSIVAGPSFLQFLRNLFRVQIAGGDIIQFEHKSNSKYYMLSATGTWDEIIKLS